MYILVYQYENEKFTCPKCGEKIKFNKKLIDILSTSNNDINDILVGLKIQIENVMQDIGNNKAINYINSQLKNINIIINNAISELKKNKENINQLCNFNQTHDLIKKQNIIEGELDIKVNDINDGVLLFNRKDIKGIEVYLNNKQVNLKNKDEKWIIDYNFKKDGRYKFKIIFNNAIEDLTTFFFKCLNLYSIDLSNFDTSNITSMRSLFNSCSYLREIKGLIKLKTNNVSNMRCLFNLCKELQYLDLSNFDTSNVIDMSYMFNECNKLREIRGLNRFITKNVSNMEYMFSNCEKLEYLDLSTFDISRVNEIEFMFNECKSLKEIKGLSSFSKNKVNKINSMFENCYELECIDLSNFDTSEITDMSWAFNFCLKLKEIKGINNFNTSKVENMESMFKCCEKLEYLDLSNFDTSNVSNMKAMFGGCHSLHELKGLNKFNTSNVTSMKQMFQECKQLKYLDLSEFDSSNLIDMRSMFYGCTNLKYLNISNFYMNDITDGMFSLIDKDKCKIIANDEHLRNLFTNEN